MSFEKPKSISQQERKAEENAHIVVALRSASAEKIAHFLKNGNEEQKRVRTEIDQEITLIDQKITSRESALHATNDTAGGMTAKKEELETHQKEKNALMAKREKYADEIFKNIDQQSLRDYINTRKGENINGKKEELQELQKEIVRLQGIIGMENRYDSKKQFDASDVAQGKFEGEKRKLTKYEQDAQRLSDDIEESEKIGLVLSLLGERSGKEDEKNEEKKADVEIVADVPKGSRDTDMDEENKFDREVQRRENIEAEDDVTKFQKEWDDIATAKKEAHNGKKIEIRHEKIEEMRAILVQKREVFVRKDMAINTALAKLRKLPWNKDGNMAAQKEVQIFREDYESAFKALENFLLDNYNELSPEDRKNLVQDVVEGRNMEVASLQEQRTQIKSEGTPIIQKYLPTFSRWARNKNVQKTLAVGSIGLGAISGSVRTALSMAPKIALKLGAGETTMSALKFTAATSKFLAPIGAGVAVGMGTAKLFEKWQKSRFEKEKSAEKKAFSEMTEEEKFLRLMDFDHGTIVNDAKRLEAISGNAKLAGLITGAIAGGSVFMLMGGDAHGAEDIVKSDTSVDHAFLNRAGKPLLDVEPKNIDGAEVEAALRDGSVTEAWLDKYTSYNDHITEFQSQGFHDTQAYADFQKEYNTEAFKKFVEEHPDTPRQEVINNWEKGMIARSNMIADRVHLERDVITAQRVAQEMHITDQNPTLDIHEGSVILNGKPVPQEIWEKYGYKPSYLGHVGQVHVPGAGLESDPSLSQETIRAASTDISGQGEEQGLKKEGVEGLDPLAKSHLLGKIFAEQMNIRDVHDIIYDNEGVPQSINHIPVTAVDREMGLKRYNFEELTRGKMQSAWVDTRMYDGMNVADSQDVSASAQEMNVSRWKELTGDISIDPEKGIGILAVKEGSNISRTIQEFLENQENHKILSEGKMGWDPEKYHSVHEWAQTRATVLANEYAKAHPGIDIDHIRPDTKIILDLHNLADVKTNIDFEGGPHIVPDATKVELPHAISPENVGDQAESVVKEIYTKGDMQRMFGMNEDQYTFFDKAPADKYFEEIKHVNPDKAQSNFDKAFIKIIGEKNIDLSNKTVMEVLRTHEISSLQDPVVENAVKIETPTAPVENVQEQAEQPTEIRQKQEHTTQNGDERVVRRSKNADEFFSHKEGTRVMSTGFSFTPDTPAGDIAKELTQRGVDKEYAQKLASEYKNDTSIFGDAMEKRQAMMKLNMKLREHLESNGKSFYDSAREIRPGHDVQPSLEQGHEKIIRRSPLAKEFMQNSTDALHKNAQLSQSFAEKMGEKDIFNVKAKLQGGVPVEINGKPVPEELYTPDQLQRVKTARHLNDLMSQGENAAHARDVAEHSVDTYKNFPDDQIMRALREQPRFHEDDFVRAVAREMRSTFDTNRIENIAGAKISFLRADSVAASAGYLSKAQFNLEDVISRAKDVFGPEIGEPRPGATVRSYFASIMARAKVTGTVDRIFPPEQN